MILKWLVAQGIWIFNVVVLGGFTVMILMDNPLSLQNQCAAVKDGVPYPEPFKHRADEDFLDQFMRYQDYKKLIERCKQLKQHQNFR